MELFYCKIDTGNFGDDMNAWFWDLVCPEFRVVAPNTTLFGIGTILWRNNFAAFPEIIVAGSGAGKMVRQQKIPEHVCFAFVRGPLTADTFGLPSATAITDPACLISHINEFRKDYAPSKRAVFIPHCGTARLPLDWGKIANLADMEYVSPECDAKEVIQDIARARLVVTESLHGAIIADAFRVPWVPIAISPTFSSFKWLDWCASMEVDPSVHSSLSFLKETYGIIKMLKQRIRSALPDWQGASTASIVNSQVSGAAREYGLSASEKKSARRAVRVLSGVIERTLVADLKEALRGRQHLSKDAVLLNRQDAMLERLDVLMKSIG